MGARSHRRPTVEDIEMQTLKLLILSGKGDISPTTVMQDGEARICKRMDSEPVSGEML